MGDRTITATPTGRLSDGMPYYGRLGEVAYEADEDKVQCHLCGDWFCRVGGSHLIRSHGWTLDDYRRAFRLPRHVATCSAGYSERQRQLIAPRVAPGGDFAGTAGRFKRDRAAAREAVSKSAARRIVAGAQVPFLTRRPELREEWHSARNAGLSADVLGMYSTVLAWWCCATCGHEWQATVNSRAHGSGCPRCYIEQNCRQLRNASLRAKRAAVAARPLAKTDPAIAAELHPTRNPGLDAKRVSAGSGLRLWWRCPACGHEWQARVGNRTNKTRPHGCPVCAGRYTPPNRSLARIHPTLYVEWHLTRNEDLDPFSLSPGSGKKAWWHCAKCGHDWEARVIDRARTGTGCPACFRAKTRTPPVTRPDLPA